MSNRDAHAGRQALPRATLRRSLGLSGRKSAGERMDLTTRKEGDKKRGRLSVDGLGRDGLNSP